MKSYIPLLALAASVEATFKKNAPPFSCPANTNNKCTPKQNSGFDWSDLVTGPFTNYGDFNFKGFTCGGGGGGTGRSGAGGGGKFIGGTCHPEKGKSPSFGSKDNFSVGSIRVEPEFDCDLEFHYDMPNGSVCKHRNSCKKSGTTVVNKQCGGAKGVTIIYPPQPGKPKPSCSIKVPTVSFDCSTASSTKTPSSTKATSTKATSKATSTAVTTTSEVKTSTSAVKPESSTSAAPATSTTVPAESSTTTAPAQSSTAPVESSTAPGQTSTAPSETSTAVVPGSSTKPAESSTAPSGTSTAPSETSTAPGGTSTAPGETSTAPGETSTDVSPGSSTVSAATSTPITTVITTEFESTSTVFSTVVSTITSCAPEVPNCPASGGVTTTVVTVAISTTICPVTETRTTVISSATAPAGGESTAPAGGASSVPAGGDSSAPASVGTTSAPIGGGASTTVAVGTTLTTVKPIETLPCPDVVPSCVNTFMFSVGCKDSTDIACYCPDALFVKNVYDCLYAHGESDQIISEAVIFFQGICAPWVGGNPAVVTAPTVTSYLTVTAAPTAAPVYTTITVDATTVVPCTDEAGQEIPSSSTTVVISTTMQVPQIGFTTGVQGGVDLIPITAAPIVDGGNNGGNEGGNNNGGGAVITNGTTIQVPTGTGSIRPTSSVVLAGSGRVGTSFGLAAAVAALAAFAL